MEFRILGPLEVRDEHGSLALGGIKPRSVIAMLLLHANEPVSSERLALALWGEQAQVRSVELVHVYISRLRKALGDPQIITTTRAGYCLRVRPGELDAARCAVLVEDGRQLLEEGRPEEAASVLREALSLSRGPPLADLAYERFAADEIVRLEELQLEALEARIEADLAVGRHASLVGELQQLVVTHPTRERLARHLLLALYRCDRQAEALEAYHDVRRVLVAQYGVEPGPDLRGVHDAVLRQDPILTPPDILKLSRERAVTSANVARRARRVRFNVPLMHAQFTGRSAELDAIDEAFVAADRAVVTQAITGLGGVGKSQLAARYIHQLADQEDVVAWIRAEDGGVADLSELAAALGLRVENLTPRERAAEAVRWLGSCEERWLLVLDNVAAPEQLRDCCPSPGNGRVIITTRDRAMAQFGAALRVDVFDEATAVEYLLATSGRAGNRDGATRLARALGCLPLALSHAAAYCAAGTSFDDYLELLEALPAAELFDSHPEASYAQTVASTWQISIQAAERTGPLARPVLAMAAHLAPDAIPRTLFEVLLDDARTPAARKPLLDAFNALHRLSLAQVDDAAISVHRLLQKTIRDDACRRGDMTAAASALAAVTAAFPDTHDQPQTWPQSERLLPHALAIAAVIAKSGEEGEQLVTLLNSASAYLLGADSGPRAVDTATNANACAERILGPEHPDTLSARACLAAVYHRAGKTTEAIDLGEQVLAARVRILGPEHPDTLTTGANLSQRYWEAGRITDAIELGERVLADCERILGPEHPDTLAATLMMIAVSYDVAGRADEAIELGERVLADCERILGPEHHDTLIAGVLLGLSYRSGGRVDEAIELGERVLGDCERILGPEHFETLRTRMIVAFSYRAAGRVDEAIELGRRVLAESERNLGPEHLYTLRARMILAVSYQAGGRAPEAIELGERVLAETERILGAEHPDTVRARTNLAGAYATAGREIQAPEQRDSP